MLPPRVRAVVNRQEDLRRTTVDVCTVGGSGRRPTRGADRTSTPGIQTGPARGGTLSPRRGSLRFRPGAQTTWSAGLSISKKEQRKSGTRGRAAPGRGSPDGRSPPGGKMSPHRQQSTLTTTPTTHRASYQHLTDRFHMLSQRWRIGIVAAIVACCALILATQSSTTVATYINHSASANSGFFCNIIPVCLIGMLDPNS